MKTCKKFLLTLFALFLLANIFVACTPSKNELEYKLIDNSYYEVSGIGTCKDTEIDIPAEYNGLPVKSIGEDAFKDCSSLTSITIPDSITRIGYNAFSGCTSLENMTLPFVGGSATNNTYLGYIFGADSYDRNSNYVPSALKAVTITNATSLGAGAFCDCSSLTSITIPNSVTSIGEDAFYGCTSLTSITIPDSVTSVGKNAFENCSNLTGVYITDLEKWCQINFSIYTANPLFYAHNLYLNGTLITELVIPDSITSIGSSAFAGCNMTSITMPDGVRSIGFAAFYDCSNLTSITIPDSVTSIGNHTFAGCNSLMSITIPDSVTSIGFGAFENCNSLTSITVPFVGATKDDTDSFNYIFGEFGSSSLKTIVITGGSGIGEWAFSSCSSLTSITIPNSVTSIGSYAFSGCSNLTSITFTGTQAEWDAITKGNDWNYNCPATVVCTGTEATE